MPTANYVNGTNSSTSVTASAGSLHTCIDDAPGNPASDGDYIYSYDGNCSLSFPSVSDPGNDYNWKLKTRNKHDGSGMDSNSIEFKLYGGGSLIKSWTPTIGTSYTYREVILSAAEGALVRANRTNLDLEIWFTPIGGSGATGYVSAFNLEAPDAPVTHELAAALSAGATVSPALLCYKQPAVELAAGASATGELSAEQSVATELAAGVSITAWITKSEAIAVGLSAGATLVANLASVTNTPRRNIREIRVPLESVVEFTASLEAIGRTDARSRIIEEVEA